MDGEQPLLAIQDVQIQIFAFPVCEEEFVEEVSCDGPEAAGGEGDGFVDGIIDALDPVFEPGAAGDGGCNQADGCGREPDGVRGTIIAADLEFDSVGALHAWEVGIEGSLLLVGGLGGAAEIPIAGVAVVCGVGFSPGADLYAAAADNQGGVGFVGSLPQFGAGEAVYVFSGIPAAAEGAHDSLGGGVGHGCDRGCYPYSTRVSPLGKCFFVVDSRQGSHPPCMQEFPPLQRGWFVVCLGYEKAICSALVGGDAAGVWVAAGE